MEPLQWLIKLAADAGAISWMPGRPEYSRTSLYADDAVVFLNPIKSEMLVIKEILEVFGKVSGLQVNFSKCAAYPVRCDGLDLADILQPLAVPIAALPCTYLGMPLSLRWPKRAELQPLLDKIGKRLASWKHGLL